VWLASAAARAQAGLMGTFTLIVWIMMGMRFEETRIENLGRAECLELKLQIEGDREHAHGKCVAHELLARPFSDVSAKASEAASNLKRFSALEERAA
jgi:hypothetical protein